jgi:hypothetical protein
MSAGINIISGKSQYRTSKIKQLLDDLQSLAFFLSIFGKTSEIIKKKCYQFSPFIKAIARRTC